MKKEEIRTPKAPLPGGPYSQGLKVGSRIYVSGQRPVEAQTNAIPEGLAAQAAVCLENVRHVLEAAGAGMENVVAVNVYLADIGHFEEFNEVYKGYFTAPFPTRTTISCSLRGILVEVSVIAEL